MKESETGLNLCLISACEWYAMNGLVRLSPGLHIVGHKQAVVIGLHLQIAISNTTVMAVIEKCQMVGQDRWMWSWREFCNNRFKSRPRCSIWRQEILDTLTTRSVVGLRMRNNNYGCSCSSPRLVLLPPLGTLSLI